MPTPKNRLQLTALLTQLFLDNTAQAITPADAREVLGAIIESAGLLLGDLSAKADLVDGKVPAAQLPVPAAQLAGIPAWNPATTYAARAQVTYGGLIWESLTLTGNTGITPQDGPVWRELSPTHLPGNDTQIRTLAGLALTADYILANLSGPGGTVAFATEAEWLALAINRALSPSLLKPKLDAKVDKSGVKILTDENYTALEKNKLVLLPQNPVRSVNGVSPDPTTGNVIVSTGTGAADIRVATIAARNGLTGLGDNQNVFVVDATGDPTVAIGSAYYKYILPGGTWTKLSEAESMDLTFSGFTKDASGENTVVYTWAGTLNSFFSGIATIVPGQALLRTTLNWLAAKIITVQASVLTSTDILALALAGLGSLTGTITSADSIIQAFSRVKGFIDNIAATIRGTLLTGLDTNLPGTATAMDSILQAVGKLQRQVNLLGAPSSGVLNSATLDFAARFQTTAINAIAVTAFANAGLGRSVKIIAASSVTSFSVTVSGYSGYLTGFGFRPGVVNIIDIIIISATEYELFCDPQV